MTHVVQNESRKNDDKFHSPDKSFFKRKKKQVEHKAGINVQKE